MATTSPKTGRKTMAFRDTTAEILGETRISMVKVGDKYEHPEVPDRLTPAWVKGVCEKFGVEKFKIITLRSLYWQRAYEMGAHYGEWRKEQVVGIYPRGGHGVFTTKVTWPGY
jgi:hypothetical protein